MKQRQHLTAALLALCLLLTACGGKQEVGGPAQTSAAAAYTADVAPLDLEVMQLTASGAGGGYLYLAATEEEETEPDGEELSSSFSYSSTVSGDDGDFAFYSGGAEKAVLYRLNAATGDLVKLAGYTPGEGASIAVIVPCEDGSLWVLEQTSGMMDFTSLADMEDMGSVVVNMGDFDSPGSQVWRKLDATGEQELDRVDVSELAQKLGVEAVTDTRMDREGRLYAAAGSTVTVLDTGLSTLAVCKGLEPVERLISLSDGGVGAVTASEESLTVYPVDVDGQTLGEARPLTGSANKLYDGNEKYDFLYSSGDSLYGWSKETSVPEKLLSWSGAGVDKGQVTALCILPDGTGAAVLRDGSMWLASYSLARLAPAGEDALAGRTVLTLATMGLDSQTRARVLEFNRTSSTHRIEVRDYSEYNTAEDASAGVSKLNTEILAGDMPDLLDVTGISLRRYAARGLLEDLWPYIESDAGLGREGVMEKVLQEAEIGGKLYRVFSRFSIETAAGAPSVVGDKMGWTLEDLRTALAKQPAGYSVLGPNETKNSIFETMFANSLDRFVDWDAGTASFDSPEFQAILEFCASFPDQARSQGEENVSPYTWAARGEQMLLPVYLGDLASVQLYRALFGGEITFVGYPGEGGAVRFQADGGLAMSASCKDKDGAWTFLRQALLPGGEQFVVNTSDFAVNRADFEREARESMETNYLLDEDGNTITGSDGEPMLEGTAYVVIDTMAIMLKPATQEDYDQVMALYEAAEGFAGRDENIWAIVQECAGTFFAGDRTAEDAARMMQNRVELYLNEQK